MFKKIAVLALAWGLSTAASAAYIQYDLKNVGFDDGTSVSGWFVQDTANQGVAFYYFKSIYQNYIPAFDSDAYNATITVPGGPTSFATWSENNGVNHGTLTLHFGRGATPGAFSVGGFEESTDVPANGGAPNGFHTIVGGTAELGQIDPILLGYLETGTSGFAEVVPNALPNTGTVPEPGSIALVAAGLGLMGRLRRRGARAAA